MNQRHNGGDSESQNIVNEQLKQLFEDDAFLSDLSRGVDPSAGSDPSAGLLLDLQQEANVDMPATPDLSVLLPADDEVGTDASTDIIVALEPRRHRLRGGKKKSASHPFLHGLVGAAAATLVIAGGGTALYNADANSPLYGLSNQIFGSTDNSGPSVVELASTLDEVDSRTANGDVEGARELLEQARGMLRNMEDGQRSPRSSGDSPTVPQTQTVTATVTEVAPADPQQPQRITETVVATTTVVTTVTQTPIWTPDPSATLVPPQTEPAEPTVTSEPGLISPQ